MRARSALAHGAILVSLGIVLTTGCGGSGYASGGYYEYDDRHWHDPWYDRPYCRGCVVVRPPPHHHPDHRPPGGRPPDWRPPGGRPPDARPPGGRPTQLPSLPSRPRPGPRPAIRR